MPCALTELVSRNKDYVTRETGTEQQETPPRHPRGSLQSKEGGSHRTHRK